MRSQTVRVVWFLMMLMAAFAMSKEAVAVQKPEAQQTPPEGEGRLVSLPGLADLTPLSTELFKRSFALEKNIAAVFNLSAAEEKFNRIDEKLKALSGRLQTLKNTGRYGFDQLSEFKAAIFIEGDSLRKIVEPLTEAVRQVEAWSKEWSEEKTRWNELRSSLQKNIPLSTVTPTFAKAHEAIDKVRKLTSHHLQRLLAADHKAGNIRTEVDSLTSQVDDLIIALRSEFLRKSAPSMFSSAYYNQFHKGLWDEARKGLDVVPWIVVQALQRNALVFFLQIFLSLVLAVGIIRNRRLLAAEERWRFVAERPFAAGVFVGFTALRPFYGVTIGMWRLLFVAVASISTARLAGGLIVKVWKRRLVYGLAILLILTQLLSVISMPLPLFRVYVFFVALIGLFLCAWRTLENVRKGDSFLYTWVLGLGGIVSMVALLAEIGGYSALAAHLLVSSLKTTLIVIAAWILMLLVRGVLDWTFHSSPLIKIPLLRKYASVIDERLVHLINLLIGALVITYILVVWRVYESHVEAIQGVLSIGLTVGSWRITVGLVIIAAALLYCSFIASRAVQSVLMEEVFPRRHMERGVQISMGRLVHYGFVLLGFLLALAALGVDLKNITIIGGAFGIGIGFGLQTIVNNFICGIILLFERPIKVGDYIELGGQWAEIKKIGLRSTIIQTFDRADIVVPNADLITNQVTNWTRSDRLARIRIPIGVAYGSDVTLVMKILLECVEENPLVMRSPASKVYFIGFGESSLDFQLRVYLSDIDNWYTVQSELLQEIDRKFRLEGVEIPFPQRDLHVRSVDESAASTLLRPESQRLSLATGKEGDEID